MEKNNNDMLKFNPWSEESTSSFEKDNSEIEKSANLDENKGESSSSREIKNMSKQEKREIVKNLLNNLKSHEDCRRKVSEDELKRKIEKEISNDNKRLKKLELVNSKVCQNQKRVLKTVECFKSSELVLNFSLVATIISSILLNFKVFVSFLFSLFLTFIGLLIFENFFKDNFGENQKTVVCFLFSLFISYLVNNRFRLFDKSNKKSDKKKYNYSETESE